jgi:hypothetical protein
MARPTKLTPELKVQLLALVRASVPSAIAASSLGICTKTLQIWIDRSTSETEGVYFELGQDIEQARAQAKLPYIAAITKSARTNTKDAKWMLERLDPDHFERRRLPIIGPERPDAHQLAADVRRAWEEMDAATRVAPPEPPSSEAGPDRGDHVDS